MRSVDNVEIVRRALAHRERDSEPDPCLMRGCLLMALNGHADRAE